ncbi:hypothetical protein [Glycomyces sp. YM15]|uniref:hypothetical protein n=1 Tax=Glycomyces sp. YM15 TaxID=2800446 RepID=UPI0019642827|nr:hypothetical protein [Glycomyces sp. YM15]
MTDAARPLTENERAILRGAAVDGLPDLDHFCLQIDAVEVDYDPSYADIGLRVVGNLPIISLRDGIMPVNIDEIGEDGQLLGIVWIILSAGYISGIEYTDFAEDRSVLPSVERLTFSLADPNDKMIHEFRE